MYGTRSRCLTWSRMGTDGMGPASLFPGLREQEFQGYRALELQILGLVDHTHPTATELRDDSIVRYGLTDHVAIQPVKCQTSLGTDALFRAQSS